MYVLDTNTLIYYFKKKGGVADKLLSVSPKEIAIPSIVLFELRAGIAKSISPQKRAAQLEEILSLIGVLPFSEREASTSAKVRATLEQKGTPIGPYDTLIAGTTLAHGGILVTNNVKEFSRVPKLEIVNWYEE